jgi:hypothetical protein
MTDNGVQDLDQATPRIEDTPRPKPDVAEAKTPEAKTETLLLPAPEAPAAASDDQDIIRSIYATRTAAAEPASPGDFAGMDMEDGSVPLRGAYLTHLSETGGEAATAGDRDVEGASLVRGAYVAHLTADAVAPRPKRAAPSRGRTAVQKKSAKKKAGKARAIARPKAKKAAARPAAKRAVRRKATAAKASKARRAKRPRR